MAQLIKGVLKKFQLERIQSLADELLVGCVFTAGLGQSPANQIAAAAGLNTHTNCSTIGKVCCSGMKAVMVASQAIALGSADFVIAGGVDCMSLAPHYLQVPRSGTKTFGSLELEDSIQKDGLTDAFSLQSMGLLAENVAAMLKISREAQDAYTIESYKKATSYSKKASGIVPVSFFNARKEEVKITEDDEPKNFIEGKIPHLKPAFSSSGTITAASSSKLADGAAVLFLVSGRFAERHNLRPIAKIRRCEEFTQEPEKFALSPIGAIKKCFQSGETATDFDAFEINEAFAVAVLASMQALGIQDSQCNVNGGAISLGHPLGCSGARIICSLIEALHERSGRRGIAAICHGGGGATAVSLELLSENK